MKTANVQIHGNQLGILWQVITRFQPQSMAEQRGHSRIMTDFGLDVIEAKLLSGGEGAKIELPQEATECVISEAAYLYLCAQWDRLIDIFPAVKNDDGSSRPPGIPNIWSRLLAPLFTQLDKEFKLGDYAETEPAQPKTPA